MTYIRVTHTIPEELRDVLDKLDTERGINKSALVTLAIREYISKYYPDYLKEHERE